MATLLALLALDGWIALRMYRQSQERAGLRQELSEVNGIEYGLLSVDAWIGHLRHIVAHQVDHFALSERQRRVVHEQLEQGLTGLIERIGQLHPTTLKGKIGKAAIGAFATRQQVPQLVDAVMEEAGKPETRHALKRLLIEKVDEYAAESRDNASDPQNLQVYYKRAQVKNRRDFNRVTMARTSTLEADVRRCAFVLVGSLVLALLACTLVYLRPAFGWLRKPLFVLAVLLASEALLAGLSSPMIEIDARIRRVDFVLLGERLQFDDQVLFYQSKSILQVVGALFEARQADSIFVGTLILMFSILLPITKLVCTQLVLLGGEWARRSRVLQVLAFKTGKWSMADVLVVAIFMAYVGFKAILDSQLQDLNVHSEALSSIATNHTTLQPAFMVFTSFVLFGLALAELIKRATAQRAEAAKP